MSLGDLISAGICNVELKKLNDVYLKVANLSIITIMFTCF